MEQWAARQFQGSLRDEVLTLNAAALGQVEVYRRIEELEFEQFLEVIQDDDSQ
jgi:hypothetical protein